MNQDVRDRLERLDAYDAWRWAEELFEGRDYLAAVQVLRHLVDSHADDRSTNAAVELLARSYFHSAQLARAADTARELLRREPTNAYAALLLTRALERASRHEEAASARRLAEALGSA